MHVIPLARMLSFIIQKSQKKKIESMEILANKKILIVGATGGLGRETAQLIKNSQGKIICTGRNTDKLKQLGNDLNLDPKALIPMDITNPMDVERATEQVFEQFNRLDILINATGVGIVKPFEDLSYDDFQKTLDVNLKGTFHLVKNFIPKMKAEKKGLFINIPGVLGKVPMAGAVAYAASKYGVNGMMKSLREEAKKNRGANNQCLFGRGGYAFLG